MAATYDAIVIGGGLNGLVTAAYLVKAGLRTVVLERRGNLGGIAATEAVFPGFKFDTLAHSLGPLHPAVVRDLNLAGHGLHLLPAQPSAVAPLPGGRRLALWPDAARTIDGLRPFSQRDAERWPKFVSLIGRMAAVLETIENATMPHMPKASPGELLSLAGLGRQLQQLSGQDRPEFLRFIPMSVYELLTDWFETPALQGLLGAVGVAGLLQGPRATGTALNFLHHHVGAAGVMRGHTLVRGGLGGLAEALASAARGYGVEIRTEVEVLSVLVNGERAVGVAAASGEEVRAQMVVSSIDPKQTMLRLVDPLTFGPDFVRHVSNIKMRGCVAKVNLALGELPQFSALSAEHLHGKISISPDLDYIERAYDAAKYGRLSERPYLECVLPSLADPSRAPAGQHVLSVWAQYAPYHLRAGTWDDNREKLGDLVVDTLAEYAPNLKNAILHRQVLTPADLESTFGLSEGSVSQGEMMLEHLFFMRPVPGWAQYRTPLPGLYLCGAGVHPGSGLAGRPGFNAAREILADARRAR